MAKKPENSGLTGKADKGGKSRPPPPEGARFKPGESGNPGGRPKAFKAFREACQSHLDEVLETWISVLRDPVADTFARLKAGEHIAAYAVGKPPQAVTIEDPDGTVKTLADLIREASIAGANETDAG